MLLKKEYPNLIPSKLKELFSKHSLISINSTARRLGLLKSDGYLGKGINKWQYKPCVELAYILGVLKGDGCVSINTKSKRYRIALDVISGTFANEFKKNIELLGIPAYYWFNKRNLHCVEARSKQFCMWYKTFDEDALVYFLRQDKQFLKAFLKGFFDSEGYFYYYYHNGSTYPQPTIGISNTNKVFLELIKREMELQLCLKGIFIQLKHKKGTSKVIQKKGFKTIKDCFAIIIHQKTTVKYFINEISTSVAEKQYKMDTYLKLLDKVKDVKWNGHEFIKTNLCNLTEGKHT